MPVWNIYTGFELGLDCARRCPSSYSVRLSCSQWTHRPVHVCNLFLGLISLLWCRRISQRLHAKCKMLRPYALYNKTWSHNRQDECISMKLKCRFHDISLIGCTITCQNNNNSISMDFSSAKAIPDVKVYWTSHEIYKHNNEKSAKFLHLHGSVGSNQSGVMLENPHYLTWTLTSIILSNTDPGVVCRGQFLLFKNYGVQSRFAQCYGPGLQVNGHRLSWLSSDWQFV